MSGGFAVWTVEVDLSLARPAVALCRVASLVIGEVRALRLATWAGLRLTRWRITGHRRWHWLGRVYYDMDRVDGNR